jgi:(p)ppGpp synthase/HD superfamily hydrolase
MKYTPNINKAINIMYNAHKEQYDKGNYPYVFHPYHVAEQMNTEEEIIVALLHDVVEDTNITIEDLSKEGFNSNIIEALKLLTKKTDNYEEYISKISTNSLAKKIKLIDLKHNMDITRIPNPQEKDYKRIEQYKKAIEILNNNNT